MPTNKALLERVLAHIRRQGLVRRGQLILVGVSGGPDSVCLLHILDSLKDELGISLHIAHLDHQLRGAEARGDAAYVKRLAATLGLPATLGSADVRQYQAANHLSLEEAAREVRYDFFARTAEQVGADCVAVGHTTDDHVETVLMHLIRGAGINGLRGLLSQNEWRRAGHRVTVIRPLLPLTRRETVEYCREHRLEPRTDATNVSMSPLRNRIRLQLLPLLREYNPKVTEALVRTARIAADDIDFLRQETGKAWRRVATEYVGPPPRHTSGFLPSQEWETRARTISFDKKGFQRLAPALQRELLLNGIEKTLGRLKDIELVHVEEVMAALDKPAGRQIVLPHGLRFVIEYDRYLLTEDPAELCPFPPLDGEYRLEVPGTTVIPGWEVTATVRDGGLPLLKGGPRGIAPLPPNNPSQSPFPKGRGSGFASTAVFDSATTGDVLFVRARKPGDRFQPSGLGTAKKINQFMIDARIPHAWRERVPLVCSPDGIMWVAGYRTDERVKVTEETKQVLAVEFRRTDE